MSSRTKTQTISNLGRKENSMLLNYTPVIADLLLLVGIVGAIIGLLFFTVSDEYTLPAGPSHPIPMKNFDEHVTVQGRNVTIKNLPKAYTLYSESGDALDRISGEYKDGKLIVDSAEYELSKSDIR